MACLALNQAGFGNSKFAGPVHPALVQQPMLWPGQSLELTIPGHIRKQLRDRLADDGVTTERMFPHSLEKTAARVNALFCDKEEIAALVGQHRRNDT